MKTKSLLLSALSSLLFLPSGFPQGSLTPPVGPLAPTMKRLDEVEPRTLIKSLPATLPVGGSYYLTASLTGGSGQNGITVVASHVTIDLNGFELIGGGGAGAGVFIGGGVSNVTIRNGTIRNWGSEGVNGATNPLMRAENLIVRNNGASGLLLDVKATVFNCIADGNVTKGINVFQNSVVVNSQAVGTTGVPGTGIVMSDSCVLRGCTASGNAGNGVSAAAFATIDGCTSSGNTDDGFNVNDGATISNSSANENGTNGGTFPNADGFKASFNCTVHNCAATKNTGNGLNVTSGSFYNGATVRQSTFTRNSSAGISLPPNSTVVGCTANENGTIGIFLSSGSSVSDSTANLNTTHGIQAGANCRIFNNSCTDNGAGAPTGYGIAVLAVSRCHIEGNRVAENDEGIHVAGSNNIVLRNTASGNTTNYVILAGNSFGPVVAVAAVGNISGVADSGHSGANFSY
ncbi:MAG TPA: right-handed parallel beta-helix repeat-containing protein [Chthoniobacteraceae bacterium]|nr:right-handed parallel beta-helix repeat-containing protein [Chthoniobacteraceae bacterium]